MLAAGLVLALAACSPRSENAPGDFPSTLGARRAVWSAIQPLATARKIDPLFVYAVVKIESNFNPRAKHGENRGLLQIKPRAWRAVSSLPYEAAVWDWRANLVAGLDGMLRIKQALAAKGKFSYPVLWACYHYGYDYVAARNFDMNRVPVPTDSVAYKLWSGEIHPIPPPQ